jgi:hypothetical protein
MGCGVIIFSNNCSDLHVWTGLRRDEKRGSKRLKVTLRFLNGMERNNQLTSPHSDEFLSTWSPLESKFQVRTRKKVKSLRGPW